MARLRDEMHGSVKVARASLSPSACKAVGRTCNPERLSALDQRTTYQRVHGGHVDTYRARWLRSRADGQLEQLFPPISFGDKKEFQIYSKKTVSFPYFLFKIYLFILNRGTNHNYEPVTSSKILLDKR